MKKIVGMICIMMALLLLASCAPINSSVVETNSNTVSSLSQNPDGQQGSWRQSYYEIVAAEIDAEGEPKLQRLSLCTLESREIPLLSVSYGAEYRDEKYLDKNDVDKIWTIQDGVPVLLWQGQGYLVGVMPESDAVVIYFYEGRVAKAISSAGEIPLYEYRNVKDIRTLYTFADDREWTPEEEQIHDPIGKLGIEGSFDYLNLSKVDLQKDALKKRAEEYLFDSYDFAIPAEAPEWIKKYMKYIKSDFSYSYTPEKKMDLSGCNQLRISEPLGNGMAPILQTLLFEYGVYTDTFVDNFYYMLLGDTMHHGASSHENGGTMFCKDESNGKLLMQENSLEWYRWYSIDSNGTHWMFNSGADYFREPPYRAFIQQEEKYFDSIEERITWLAAREKEVLASFGYTDWVYVSSNTYILPSEATWPELEKALINIFCQYAKDNGMWN